MQPLSTYSHSLRMLCTKHVVERYTKYVVYKTFHFIYFRVTAYSRTIPYRHFEVPAVCA